MIRYNLNLAGALLLAFLLFGTATADAGQDFCSRADLRKNYFIENRGQLDRPGLGFPADIRYYANLEGLTVLFRDNSISYIFKKYESPALSPNNRIGLDESAIDVRTYRTDLAFPGSNQTPELIAIKPNTAYFNYYFDGNESGIEGVRAFNEFTMKDLYEGIDLRFYFTPDGRLKYDFVVAPGADPNKIRIAYQGFEDIRLSGGEVSIDNTFGGLSEAKPLSYQASGTDIRLVNSGFKLENRIISFDIGDYDASKVLVIDPEIKWGTYLGGDLDDKARSVIVDRDNKVIICGETISFNFPVTAGAQQSTRGGLLDAFISKFDEYGNLLWSTYYGGDSSDYSNDLAIDNINNIYVAGHTFSKGWPVTPGAFQTVFSGDDDGTILSLDKTGARRWATYYGGYAKEHFSGIATNGRDEIALTGWTTSPDLYMPPFASGSRASEDAFVIRMSLDGSYLWGTYWAGGFSDYAKEIAYDKFGGITIAGHTNSINFPVVNSPNGKTRPTDFDIFLAQFDTTLTDLVVNYSVLFGGNSREECWGMDADENSEFIITGITNSADFPVSGSFILQNKYAGGQDAFIMKTANNARLIWSTYYGGSGLDFAYGVAADRFNNIIIAGETSSDDLPYISDMKHGTLSGTSDGFAFKVRGDGMGSLWGSYIGGTNKDWIYALANDHSGNVYLTGTTLSVDFPVKFPYQDKKKGLTDVILLKLCANEPHPEIEVIGETLFCPGDSVRLVVSEAFERYQWSSGQTSRGITVKKAGSFYVEVYDSLSCIGRSPAVDIQLYERPVAVITGELGFCEGTSTNLTLEGTYKSFKWSTGSTSKTITVTKPGKVWCDVVDSKGCKGSDTVNVIEFYNPRPKIKGPKTVCAYSDSVIFNITADPLETYTWEISGATMVYGKDSINIFVTFGSGGNATINVKAINDETGCLGYDTIHVAITDKLEPVITTNSNKMYFCEGDSLYLNAGDGYDYYQWNNGSKASVLLIKDPGKYWVRVENLQGCNGADTIEIAKYPLPDPVIAGVNSVCENSEGNVYLTKLNQGNSYQWTINGGTIVSGEGTNSITVNWGSAGTGELEVLETIDSSACPSLSDKFEVTIHPLPLPFVLIEGETEFCEGDSTFLTVPGDYIAYEWQDKSTSPTIIVKSSGRYYAKVTDDFGCTGTTDTIDVIVNPRPAVPVITQNGDFLQSSSGPYYQWFKDNEVITGANGSSYMPDTTGVYTVVVSNDFGCGAVSDSFYLWKGFASATFSLGDTIYANTGTSINVPILMTYSKNLDKVSASKFSAYLRFNRSVLLPKEEYETVLVGDREKVIKINGEILSETGEIANIGFYVALGDAICSEISLDSLIWENAAVDNTYDKTYLCLTDICFAGGTRLFSMNNTLDLMQNSPNPFSNSTNIEFEVIEKGVSSLYIIDMLGNKVGTIYEGYIEPGRYSINYTSSMLQPGVYFYILKTPTNQLSRKMEVYK